MKENRSKKVIALIVILLFTLIFSSICSADTLNSTANLTSNQVERLAAEWFKMAYDEQCKSSPDLDLVVRYYRKVIELRPDYAGAYNNMGIVYARQTRYNKAISAYQKAIELRPDYAKAYYNLELAYEKQGQISKAVHAHEMYLKMSKKKQPSLGFFTRLGLETRYIRGDTTYHISFDNPPDYGGHCESELEFPLDNFMAGINLIIGFRCKDNSVGRLNFTLLGTANNDAGTMKDSDWVENDRPAYIEIFEEDPGAGYTHPGKDLYTESDANLKGSIFDINYVHSFSINKIWSLGPMIGYRYQKFEYDIYHYKGTYWDVPVSGTGKVLDYEIKYNIPYIGFSSDLLFGKDDQFKLNLAFGYSDWAEAKDKDNHLLRGLYLENDCTGEAYLIGLNGDWKFWPRWILGFGAEYVDIDTKGVQHQNFYAEVASEITSSYWSGILRISREF